MRIVRDYLDDSFRDIARMVCLVADKAIVQRLMGLNFGPSCLESIPSLSVVRFESVDCNRLQPLLM